MTRTGPIAGLLFAFAMAAAPHAFAQATERSGKQVVDAVCSSCHAKGTKGAPKIGDRKAWSKRAQQGLSSLTEHALKGIREMPGHGGAAKLTDLEIGRAVAYMVNQSGGKWVEPASAKDMVAERSGAQVVKEQCAKCHQKGDGGAPKVGDRDAWKPRLSAGVDSLVRSAIRGHGGMPPRGDKADLTDSEVRNAILYMYDPSAAAKSAAPAPAAAKPAGMHKTVGGFDVYLGFVSAEALRKYPEGSVERLMHGGVPAGSGNYHVNVSLLDRSSKAPVTNAKVEIRIEEPGMSSQAKALESVVVNNSASYGTYVKLRPKAQYVVTVRARLPNSPSPLEARFEHKVY
ncbi:MAG TPA: c-type cytochrome [Burkholderiales bacterium]|jgi:cytochrome c5|nr:c-type cytochrome [Burkholderiales bacterium]